MAYLRRVADDQLKLLLEAMGAVLVEGPKWCGKTTTAEQQAGSVLRMQDPDDFEELQSTAKTKPSLLLLGDTPRLIDEWQDAPVLWDAVRTMVDKRGLPGQFILTGSNSVDDSKIRHTGTGRIASLKMRPMSLWESGESTGEISLIELFSNPDLDIDGKQSAMTVEQLIYSACRGGWPQAVLSKNEKSALQVARKYVSTLCDRDIQKVDGVRRNPHLARMLLRTYARNVSTLAKTSSMVADITEQDSVYCTRPTFEDYVSAFERLYIIEDIPAWCPAIRSKAAIRNTPKRGFCDPSIAVAALQLSPEVLQTQLKTFGFQFEQMCIRDLRAYSDALDGEVSYYHDKYGLEADIVLHLGDGRYALIECKLGSSEIEDGAKHLCEMHRLIREHNLQEKQNPLREPDLKIVITGGKMAYTRPDGVKVIPLACLKA